jgi:O-methyltransferase
MEENKMNKNNIMIFGTGEGSKKAEAMIDMGKVNIIAYIDNDENKHGTFMNEIRIIAPEEIENYEVDYIIIGSMYYKEITRQLVDLKVSRSKIVSILKGQAVSFKGMVRELYEENLKSVNFLKNNYLIHDYAICKMLLDSVDGRNSRLYQYPDYLLGGIDYVRLSTLELISREVNEKNLTGAIAELGVYKGLFAKSINGFFPGRDFYLFDTFEGFVEEDIECERENNFSKAVVGHLGDSTEEIVLRNIGASDNCIVKKGYFPDSTSDLDDDLKYVFVSLDVDLYKPTLEGLKYFYERLVPGGYIFVHDYNHTTYTGVKKAVTDFCSGAGINFTPISDFFGSAVITK